MKHIVALSALFVIGCGDSGTTGIGGSGGSDDGKFHPSSDGTAVDEAAGCKALRDSLTNRALELECLTTLPTCPGFVRTVGGAECLQYDGGSVDGCIAYYAEAADCDDVLARADNCAFEAIADSAPAGCPE